MHAKIQPAASYRVATRGQPLPLLVMPPKKRVRVRDQSGRKRNADQADANRKKQRARDNKRREAKLMEDKMKKKRDESGLDAIASPLKAHELAKKKTRPRVESARKAPAQPGAPSIPRPLASSRVSLRFLSSTPVAAADFLDTHPLLHCARSLWWRGRWRGRRSREVEASAQGSE